MGPYELADTFRERGWEGIAQVIEASEAVNNEATVVFVLYSASGAEKVIKVEDPYAFFIAFLRYMKTNAEDTDQVVRMVDDSCKELIQFNPNFGSGLN